MVTIIFELAPLIYLVEPTGYFRQCHQYKVKIEILESSTPCNNQSFNCQKIKAACCLQRLNILLNFLRKRRLTGFRNTIIF